MTLRLDPLVPATEAEIVHGWVVEDRAQFWMMQEHTREEVRETYQWIADQDTHASSRGSPPRSSPSSRPRCSPTPRWRG